MSNNHDLAGYYFHQGTNFTAYSYLGCNLTKENGKYIYSFRTWAPNASGVSLVSDFTDWEKGKALERITEGGVWETIIISDESLQKKAYKFRISGAKGTVCKGDPYARMSRGGDDGASLVFVSDSFKWGDKAWLKRRAKSICSKDDSFLATPINIYEVHAGSFMRHEEDNSYLSYRELADNLIPYVKAMGFTHVEFLPLMEFPYDGSWGYQVCGFYAPSSRFGDPDDFRYLVNQLHKNGIGIILDWVPAHFPKDEWGLYEFDGSPLYEYQGKDRQESRSWGTRFFDLGREEIQSFLISNAMYYLREFHIDGLRVDAVAAMLYLDYDRDAGEWVPNKDGTNLNLEAIAFFKKLNGTIFGEMPDVLMIAEESTAYGNLTHPINEGGLGFNMKWNMGWANDFYEYVSLDPVYRQYHHKALNFPIMYAFTENFCLPISHDEIVHGKKSFLDKMYGSYDDKFAQMRVALMFMYTFPGKKMMFMGTEYAPFREWDYENSLEWFMLDYPEHRYMQEFVRALCGLYLSSHELWDYDFSAKGFEWLLADENEKNLVCYRRIGRDRTSLISLISFSGSPQEVKIKVAPSKRLEVVFTSGLNVSQKDIPVVMEDGEYFAYIYLDKFSGVILREKSGNIKIKI